MYSVADYGRMLADRVRVDAYRAALAAVVKPGSVVVDLGAGIGFFALEACRLGASKVHAIETNDAISLLPMLARKNGFADRIEIVRGSSLQLTLERKADVIVSDLRGVLPLYEGNIDVLADARARLLADGGTILPERDRLFVALVESPALHHQVVGGFRGHGLDLDEARTFAANSFAHDRANPVTPEQLLTREHAWAEVVYGEPAPASHRGRVTTPAVRDGVAHGLVVWFATVLHGAIGFSTAPGESRVYGRAFLPFEVPIAVTREEPVEIDCQATRGVSDHIWSWGARTPTSTARHSTFLGDPTPKSVLTKESEGYAPTLDREGRARAAILGAMNGVATLSEIAKAVHAAHPGVFASPREAMVEIRRLSRQFGG